LEAAIAALEQVDCFWSPAEQESVTTMPHLSEELVGVGAVALLLLAALQQHHRSGGRSARSQLLAQPPAVLCKQFCGHPQGVLTQPVDGPWGQKRRCAPNVRWW